MVPTKQRRPHAIMISIPFQGHINPFMSLALKLAAKGFIITFVHLEYIHHKLSKAHGNAANDLDLFSEARLSGLDVRYTTISDGFPLEYDRDGIHFEEYWRTMIREYEGRVDEFVGKLIENDPEDVHFLVADTFNHWTAAVAEKYNLVNVSFWTEPALVFTLLYHWDLLRENGHFPCKDEADEEITYVPGVESISTKDLLSIFKEESDSPAVIAEYTGLAFESVKKADFILHNTLHELESKTLSALNKYMPNYAIGPVNFFKNLPTITVSQSFWSESDCTDWLESKPPASVLYVSFGSFVQTNKQVIEEIANGLLLSEVNFIWIIRQGILTEGDAEVLPFGFEDKVKDRGLIVSWCKQVEVLSHPAVGGFLTHNGWNSTVESMWCGVPMICYPIAFDQFPNRKLVVDDWKIGINLCDNGTSVDRKEVAEKIQSLMSGSCSKSLTDEANKLKSILHNALESDGSSEGNFDRFIEDLEAKFEAKATNANK